MKGDYRDARSDWSKIASYLAIIISGEVIIILKHLFSKWPPHDFLMFYLKKKQIK